MFVTLIWLCPVRWADLAAFGKTVRWLDVLLAVHGFEVFETSMFNADPHPGNITVRTSPARHAHTTHPDTLQHTGSAYRPQVQFA